MKYMKDKLTESGAGTADYFNNECNDWYNNENVWLNPPYGKYTKAWLKKIKELRT